jgi:hypothetical protein
VAGASLVPVRQEPALLGFEHHLECRLAVDGCEGIDRGACCGARIASGPDGRRRRAENPQAHRGHRLHPHQPSIWIGVEWKAPRRQIEPCAASPALAAPQRGRPPLPAAQFSGAICWPLGQSESSWCTRGSRSSAEWYGRHELAIGPPLVHKMAPGGARSSGRIPRGSLPGRYGQSTQTGTAQTGGLGQPGTFGARLLLMADNAGAERA